MPKQLKNHQRLRNYRVQQSLTLTLITKYSLLVVQSGNGQISRIKEYAAKNSILKHIAKVFREANYIGFIDNFKKKPGVIQSHLFETTVLRDTSWIVIREYDDGRFILHSLSDEDKIKTGIRKE